MRIYNSITKENSSRYYKIDDNGCWIWLKSKIRSGYGHVVHHGKVVKAHRLFWTFFRGEIPPGICVLHKCDVRACVNPEHLWLGTQKDNMQDCANKNRNRKGEKHHSAKLNPIEVLKIRTIKNKTLKEISKTYGLAEATICRIRSKKAWRHI